MENKISISVLLSEYPNSILNDEYVSLILAWIEKSGTTNIEGVSKDTGIDEKTVNEIALKLYRNKLIEFGNNYMKIAHKGKVLIDRFNLSKDIIDDAVARLDFIQEDADTCKVFLYNYRNNYFDNYLSILSSFRAWGSLLESEKEDNKDIDKKKFEQEGFISLILNHFYKSLRFINIEEMGEKLNKSELPSIKVQFNIDKSNKLDIRPLSNSFRRAHQRLRLIDKINSYKTYFEEAQKLKSEEKLLFDYLVCTDIMPQKDWDYTWFSFEAREEKPKHAFQTIYKDCINLIKERRGLPRQNLSFIGESRLDSENLTTLIKAYSILLGQNIDSLSNVLGVNKVLTVGILKQINEVIEKILPTTKHQRP